MKKKELDDAKAEFQTLEESFRKVKMRKKKVLRVCFFFDVGVFPSYIISHELQIQQEREELYKAQTIQVVQQKVDTKIELLEKRLKSITDSLERKHVQLCSVLSAPNMDQTALAGVASEIEVSSITCFSSFVMSSSSYFFVCCCRFIFFRATYFNISLDLPALCSLFNLLLYI